jgi:hypothetical protein
MIKTMLFFGLLISSLSSNGQDSKRNNQWLLGLGINVLDFNSITPNLHPTLNTTGGVTNGYSSISDTNGRLRLMCSGFFLGDSNGEIIKYPSGNWDSINCPSGVKYRSHYGNDGRNTQMSIILPKEGNTYYVITTGMSDSAYDAWQATGAYTSYTLDVLNYAVVNMDSNQGKGKVLSKNNIIVKNANLSPTWMSAVRHGNGKDWWLIKPLKDQHKFVRCQVSEQGIGAPEFQDLGLPGILAAQYGQCKFSEDGSKFVMVNSSIYTNQAFLYDFDRCTGLLSNFRKLVVPFDTTQLWDYPTGVSFSPNGKLLYVNTYIKVQQYDLADTSLTPLEVGYYGPNSAEHFNSNTAINGKIYIGNFHGVSIAMATIDSPNVKGLGCGYNKIGLTTTLSNFKSVPNITNYGLGAVNKGAGYDGCWPTLIENGEVKSSSAEILAYPNPAHTEIKIENVHGVLEVFDVAGKLMCSRQCASNVCTLDVCNWASGMYVVKVGFRSKKIIIE